MGTLSEPIAASQSPNVRIADFEIINRRWGIQWPLPQLPLETTPLVDISSNHKWSRCYAEAQEILLEVDMDIKDANLVLRPPPDPAILIRVNSLSGEAHWQTVLIAIGQMLYVKQALEIRVEIIHEESIDEWSTEEESAEEEPFEYSYHTRPEMLPKHYQEEQEALKAKKEEKEEEAVQPKEGMP